VEALIGLLLVVICAIEIAAVIYMVPKNMPTDQR